MSLQCECADVFHLLMLKSQPSSCSEMLIACEVALLRIAYC